MVNFWRLVNEVIRESDILLFIIDARFPDLTWNREIEKKLLEQNKKLIYVLNKSDLIPKKEVEKLSKNFNPCVFVSGKEKLGGTILFKKIMELGRGEHCVVGVLGYPNTGKSSVINLLKGRKAASVSSYSGHTRGLQFVKAKKKIKLIDTPGVLEFSEKDLYKQIIIGSMNPQHVKEPDYFAAKLIEDFPELFENYFDIKCGNDAYEFLEKVAIHKKILKKGAKADLQRLGRQILQDWQKGKFHEKFLK